MEAKIMPTAPNLALGVGSIGQILLLAHQIRRLGELIVWDLSRHPCVRPCVHTFKHEYVCDQLLNHNQISSGASLGKGIDCIRFWVRSDQNSGFHGNR